MEKNLPFGSIELIDKPYNSKLLPFMNKLDQGSIFKIIIVSLLQVFSFTLLLGGAFLTLSGLFGDAGFIKQYISNEFLDTGIKIGSGIGLFFGLILSLIVSWVMYSIVRKRTQQLNEVEYNGLLDFIFVRTSPRLILMIGELLFALALYAGVLQLIAVLAGAYSYAPILDLSQVFNSILPNELMFVQIPSITTFSGSYDLFEMGIKSSFTMIALSFLLLIIFYIYKEIYTYLLKLMTIFIQFLPKFALPLAIRHRNEKES